MEEYTMTCRKCGRKFKAKVVSWGYPGGKMKEEVICPYCHEENGEMMTDGRITTEKIEPQL